MIVVISSIILFALAFFLIVLSVKRNIQNKENNYRNIAIRHARTQDRIQAMIRERDRFSTQTQQVREGVDQWRAERGLRPVHGPNGIREQMYQMYRRNNGDGNGWVEDREDPRYVPEYLRINFNKANPKDGDIREECIIANQPEKGVRVYEFRKGRWHLRSTLHAMPDFLTEEDVLL